MKIKSIFLLLCTTLSLGLVTAQENKAFKLSVLSPACKGVCNGSIKVELDKNTIVPLTLTVSNGTTSRTLPNVAKTIEVKDLCAGTWTVSATPEKVESCQAVAIQIEVPDIEVKIRTLNVNNPSGTNQSDGAISITAYATLGGGEYTYTYQWSNGVTTQNVQGLSAGSYSVVVTNVQTGCQATGTFNLSPCNPNAPAFDILIEGGIISQQEGNTIPMSVSLRSAPDAPWVPIPQGYRVEWSFGGEVIHANSLEIPINLAPIEVTVKVTDACGRSKTATRKAISCNGSIPNSYANIDVRDYFLSELILPCNGESDGAAILKFWAPALGVSTLRFEYEPNAELSEVIFRKGINPEISADGIGENMYQVNIPSLKGGETYYVSGFLGNQCQVKFSFTLAEQETEKTCAGYDKKTNTCLYNEECNGKTIGPEKNFKAPAFTFNPIESVHGWNEDGFFAKCKSDLFCLCQGVPKKVENGKEAWVTTRIGEYWAVLENHSRNTGIDWVTGSSTIGRSPCAHVKYCSLDPTVIWGTFNYAEKEARGSRNPVTINGKQCTEFKCVALGFIKSKFTACVTNVPPQLPPNKVNGSRDCQVTTENLLQMVIWHQNGKLNTLWPGPDDKLTYTDSKLENLLDDYTNLADKKLRCATVSFCKNDLNVYAATNESASLCGEVITIPLKQTVASCEIASLNLGNGGWFGDSHNQAYREDLFINSGIVEKAIFYCNNASKYSAVDFYSNPVFLLPENQEAPQTFDHPQAELLSSSLLTTEEEELERLQVVIQDTFRQEKLLNFGELTFENRRIPKGIIKTDSSRVFGDYIFGDQKFLKHPAHKLVHQYANWDTETNLFMEETEPQLKYTFEYSDTSMQYQGRLESNLFLQTTSCVPQDTGLIITGVMSGELSLDSVLLASTDDLTAFYLKISRQGELMGLQLIEKIDTTRGIKFAHHANGDVIVATGFKEEGLFINGQNQSLTNDEGIFIAKTNEFNTQVVQELGNDDFASLKGLAYSTDASQIGLLVHGIDSVWHAGAGLISRTEDQLSVLSLSAQGVLKWAKKIPSSTLDLNNMAFSNGANKGLFVGLTYHNTLSFETNRLQSKGQEDIAILKYDTTGTLIQLDTFGTVDGETVSQMMPSENVVFFGGEMKGATKNRSIGLIDFINNTAFDGRVYISAVVDTLGANIPPLDTNEVAEEILQLPKRQVENNAKPLQRSVPIFAFPNPFQDELNLQFHAQATETWGLVLIDNLGSVVKRVNQQVQRGFNATKISTALLPPGMYFLQCVAPDGYVMQTIKVVKTR